MILNDKNLCSNWNNSVICNENGNCYNCNQNLQLNEFGQCNNCNTLCLSNECSEFNFESFNKNNSCADNYKNLLEVDKISNTIDPVIEDNSNNNTNDKVIIETNLDSLENSDSEDKPQVYYYYEQRSFSPENLKYKPECIFKFCRNFMFFR